MNYLHRAYDSRTVVLSRLLLIALVHLVSGCHAYEHVLFEPRVAPALGEMRGGHAAVQLYYATDRQPTGSLHPSLYFGIERSEQLALGQCEVSIPTGHGRGRLEYTLWGKRTPNDSVLLIDVNYPIEQEAYWADIRERIQMSERKEVLIFVHGYFNTFRDAARRTAQIAHDIELDGVAITYSWPSQGDLYGYLIDVVHVDWSAPMLARFLHELKRHSDAERIYLFAHSMGTRLVSKAVREYARRHPDEQPTLQHIILAAGDIDAQLFQRDYAPFLAAAAEHVSIYASSADWALGGSQRLHKYERLGQTIESSTEATLQNFSLLDATPVDKGFVGHVYYGSSPTILADLQKLLQDQTPEQRGWHKESGVYRLPTDN